MRPTTVDKHLNYQITVSRCILVFTVAWTMIAPARPTSAQLVFDDGNEHVLTGDIGNDIYVRNQSRLVTENAIMLDESYVSVNEALLEVIGGQLGTVQLINGTAEVAGTVVHAGNGFMDDRQGGINASGASTANIYEGATVVGGGIHGGIGVELTDDSQLILRGGQVIGSSAGVRAGGTSSGRMIAGEIVAPEGEAIHSGPAIRLQDQAHFQMEGGELKSGWIGVELLDSSTFEMTNGIVDVARLDPVRGGLVMHDQSRAVLRDGQFEVRSTFGFGQLFVVQGSAQLRVDHGRYEYVEIESIPRSSAIAASGNAQISVHGGLFDVFFDCYGLQEISVFDGGGNSQIKVTGGTFNVPICDRMHPIAGSIAWTRGDASMDIHGGEFTFLDIEDNDRTPPVEHLVADGQSVITVFGSDFNYPLGSIADLDGAITGYLSDGTPIEWNFVRAPTASVVLVPEPSVYMLSFFGLIGLCTSNRKASRRVA